MPIRFTFRQLEYMVAVGDAGTIALASQRINVSSPSISAAISQLEEEFGIQLFVRHHARGLSLTPGGRRLFNEARRILETAGALNDLANDISETARGPIAIGTIVTVAPLLSAAMRRSFEQAFPDASVSLREGNQIELLRMIGRAEIDVALSYDLEIPNDVHFEPLATLPPIAILPADHPLAQREGLSRHDLREEAYILLDLPISRDYFLSLFQREGLKPKIVERTTQMTEQCTHLFEMTGVKILPLETIIKTSLNHFLVIEVGVVTPRFVTHAHSKEWLLHSFKLNRQELYSS